MNRIQLKQDNVLGALALRPGMLVVGVSEPDRVLIVTDYPVNMTVVLLVSLEDGKVQESNERESYVQLFGATIEKL